MNQYVKIYPNISFPITHQVGGVNGPFQFVIPRGSSFNLSQSTFNLTKYIDGVSGNYTYSTNLASMYINRITVYNSSRQVLQDIVNSDSFSNHTQMFVKHSTTGLKDLINSDGLSSSNYLTQVLAERSVFPDLNLIPVAELQVSVQYVRAGTPSLWTVTVGTNQNQYLAVSSKLGTMYPKTLFSIDSTFLSDEELVIELTLNPPENVCFYGAGGSASVAPTSYPTTASNSKIYNLYLNIYSGTSLAPIRNMTCKYVEPELQKILVNSSSSHNVRFQLKENRHIAFITWSPYINNPTGTSMFGNSIKAVTRAPLSSLGSPLLSYDLRLDGNPIVQSSPVNVDMSEHTNVNKKHYNDSITSNIMWLSSLWFVHISTFNNNSFSNLNVNEDHTLVLHKQAEISLDTVWSGSETRVNQFVIGYLKTLTVKDGIFSCTY